MYKIKLSPYAKIFYTEWLLDPLSCRYNISVNQILHGKLDVKKLRKALKRYVAEHVILNSHIQDTDGDFCWVPNDKIVSLEYLNGSVDKSELLKYVKRGFDLQKGPLYRFRLIRISHNIYQFITVIHHIVIDASSFVDGVIEAISNYYNDDNYKEKYSTVNQVELLTHLSGLLSINLLQNRDSFKAFWFHQLNLVEKLDLRFLHSNNKKNKKLFSKSNNLIGEIRFGLDKAAVTQFQKIKRNFIITPYMYSNYIFALLLHRYTGQKKFAIAYPIAVKEGMEFIYGAQVNTNIISYQFEQKTTIAELLNQNRLYFKSLKASIDYSYYPIMDIIQGSDKHLLNVSFIQTKLRDVAFEFYGISKVEILHELNVDAVDKDTLLFEQELVENKLNYRVRFDKRSIDIKLLNNFITSYKKLFFELLKDLADGKGNKLISTYNLLDQKQYYQILKNFNKTEKRFPKNKTIHKLFEEQVLKTPNNVAVKYENIEIKYHELNEQANRLASYLLSNYQISPDDTIALCIKANADMLTMMLGVLKSGGAYVVFDPDDPPERISHILADTKPKVILTNEVYYNKLQQGINRHNTSINVIAIDNNTTKEKLTKYDQTNPTTIVTSSNLIYIIYTSGSTGRPKGVLIEHASVVNLVMYMIDYAKLSNNSVGSKFAALSFDASVIEIYPIILSGGTLCIVNEHDRLDPTKVNEFFEKNSVSFAFLPTIFAELFFKLKNNSLKHLIVAGEKLNKFHKQKYLVTNAYGPTEACVHTTSFILDKQYANIPIGKPINNVKCYIVDRNLQLLPIGAIGELLIGGEGVARGYLNSHDLTLEKFIANPFQSDEEKSKNCNGKLYKTGDLVRMLPDGNIEYIGRNDSQVKIRGYRIELGEIESKLTSYHGIKQAVAIVKERIINDVKDKCLIAYYVADSKLDPSKLQNYLKTKLPEYMLPSELIYLDCLPLSKSWKIDRELLPKSKLSNSGNYVEHTNEQERIICQNFAKVLGLEKVGINDDFFKLGGNSLKAISLALNLQANFNIKVTDIFNLRTPLKLATNAYFGKNILKQKLEQIKSSYKNKQNKNFISDKLLQNKINQYINSINNLPLDYSVKKPIVNVLLSGATGYLGCNILNQLLKFTCYNVFLLIRASSQEEATNRINKKYQFYFDKPLDNVFGLRVFVIAADIEKSNLGISSLDYWWLIDKVDSIIHAAALVKHYGEYDKFYSANVQSTINLLELAKQTKLKDFHYISTYSILNCGFIPNQQEYVYTENDLPDNLEHWDNFYIKTKSLGEKQVIKYRGYGVKTNIYRVGNLAFMSKNINVQENIKDNAFFNWLRCLFKMQTVAKDLNLVEISQTDHTAAAIVKLFDKQQLDNNIFHVFNPYLFNLSSIFVDSRTSPITTLTMEAFVDNIASNLSNNIYHDLIVRFLLHQGWLDGLNLQNTTSIKVLQNKTQNILRQLNFEWLPITIDEFNKYLELLKFHGVNEMTKKAKIFEDLERLAELLPIPIYWLDRKGVLLGANRTFINTLGANTIGKTAYDVHPKEIADKIVKHNNEVMETGLVGAQEEVIADINTGKTRYFTSVKTPLRNDDGIVIGIVGTSIEITAEKDAERLGLENEIKTKQAEKIREITAQVAHDIRSPLTSLKVIAGQLQNVDEETRIILRNATNRINDTINNLTIKYGAGGEIATDTAITPELISSLVDNLLSEKRAQYFDQNINFELNVSDDAQGLFARINAEKFKRILSNLVNNAVEAINCAKQKRGYVSLVITRENDLILLQVKDNGSGMSQELITKIGTTKITTKTEGGHGIGLSSAIPLLKEWGGDYSIESELNQGTTFTIKLPVATSPVWFQDKIYLTPNSDVIILDDDASIHNIWEARFKQFKDKVSLKHFTNSANLLEQLAELKANPNNLFLIDYELIGSENNGLAVIKKLGLIHNVFLVTSRYEDEAVKAECAKLNIKMVPKNFAPYIPLLLMAKENANLDTATADFVQPQYILIDDDFSLIKSWQMEAKMHGASLATFSRVADFEKVKSKFDKAIPIYVDYQLGTHNGIEYSKQLADEGFSNIYLATGHDKSSITEPAPWLKDIVGKEPPFASSTKLDNRKKALAPL